MKTLQQGTAMVCKTSGVILAFLCVSGVVGQEGWSVTYTPERICALKGSTVDMRCTYSYPKGHSVQKRLWFTSWPANSEPEDLSQNPQYRWRVEYRANKDHDCSFSITGLTESDSATYRFRFLTNTEGGKYTGQPGITLTVTDLQVSVDPDTVTVGQSVTLTCRTTCTLSDSPAFTWYKNRNFISYGNQYSFILASSDDTDLYSCAVRSYESFPSPAVSLKCVRAETDSDTVTEGQRVTLTCRTTCTHLSNSNYFRWYKNGQDLSNNKQELQFTASSERAGNYSCDVWVSYWKYLRSLAVTLKVTCFRVDINSHPVTDVWRVTMTCNIVCTHTRYSPAFIWYQNGKSLQNTNQKLQFTASSGDTGRYSCTVAGYENLLSNYSQCGIQTFTWYKNGEHLSNTNQDLQLTARRGDSGRYSCAVQDGHNHLLSSAVTLSVNYPPKSPSVSVSPSGVIKEGSSVTLTCSSDANPPVHRYTWFKKTGSGSSERGTGESHTITNISSEDSGQYYCEAQNQHGALSSTAVTVDVQYPPKHVKGSVSPSGEIEEGSSVTLTCSSKANPPVQRYTWFKKTGSGSSERGTGESYTFTNISSEDSGQYYCEAQNQHGALSSTAVTVDVHYSPKNTSASVGTSIIQEGSSVTLTCSSDANPPVQNYTWFKKTGAGRSERGTGESHTFTNISSEDSGQYYCEAQNQHGALSSTAVTVDVHYVPKLTSVSVSPSGEIEEGSSVTLTCSSDANPPVQSYTWFKKNESGVWLTGSGQSLNFSNFRSWNSGLRRNPANETELTKVDKEDNKSPVYDDISGTALSHTAAQDTNRGNDEAALYSAVQPVTIRNQDECLYSTAQPEDVRNLEESLYSTVSKSHPKNEDDVQYASIIFSKPSAAPRSAVQRQESDAEGSVVYTTVKACLK
ncbi:hypothetical protein AGOR_G00120610 [Albula goreensis]|uniref:B-cell receptor CD22 n=1 Tax=Albula goreensis TaxID=1534307 RepID=A0A8T3DIQ1_9TELE|nr:hypothetical protein AGOR_G00120610 [Albula goreensis]